MPVKVEYLPDESAVVIVATGNIGLDELGCQSPAAIALVKQHAASRVLVDYTDAQINVSTLDIYRLPDTYEAHGLSRNVRIAVVLPRDHNHYELFEFYADLTHNRGYSTKLFESAEDALLWLDTSV